MMGFEITRGQRPRAQKVVIYGQHGVGKTTLAARFPGAVFIDTEGGTDAYDVARLPKPQTFDELLAEATWAASNLSPCSTLVIDSVDWAETLAARDVCARAKKASIEDFGYGKGWQFVADKFSELLPALDRCVAAGVNVVLVAHDSIGKIEMPDESASYSVFGLKLSKKVAPLVKEWADAVLYCRYDTIVEVDSTGKAHARQGTRRVMQCSHTATIDAKNRWGLEGQRPMEWEVIEGFIPTAPDAAREPTPLEMLALLMTRDGIEEKELSLAMQAAGKTSEPLPVEAWDDGLVRNTCLHWDQVSEFVISRREEIPF